MDRIEKTSESGPGNGAESNTGESGGSMVIRAIVHTCVEDLQVWFSAVKSMWSMLNLKQEFEF